MKKILIAVMIAILTVGTLGCATKNDVSISGSEMLAEISIATAKSSALQAQAYALVAVAQKASTPLERHLLAEQIASLEVTESGIVRSKNGNDVAIEVSGDAGGWLKTSVLGGVGWKLADGLADAFANGGTTVNASEGATVSVSSNEEHTTAIGEDTAATSKADPIVVEVPIESTEEEI